jgi:hypothetical protein
MLLGNDAPFKKFIKPEFIRVAPPLYFEHDEVIKEKKYHKTKTSRDPILNVIQS